MEDLVANKRGMEEVVASRERPSATFSIDHILRPSPTPAVKVEEEGVEGAEDSEEEDVEEDRKKRPRTAFTAHQIKALEAEFERNK